MIRGKSIEITDKMTPHCASTLAQWIGAFNVIRNQKIIDNNAAYAAWKVAGEAGVKPAIDKATSAISKREGLEFLRQVPAEIRRNAGSCWHEDLTKALKGLSSAPRVRGKSKKRSCYVTKELFTVDPLDGENCVVRIRASSAKKDFYNYIVHVRLPFPADAAKNSLYISQQGRRFWLSIAYETGSDPVDEKSLRDSLNGLSAEELDAHVTGYDIGVVRQVTGSDGCVYHMADVAQRKLEQLERRRIRYQRRLSRIARANDRRLGTTGKKRQRTSGELRAAKKLTKLSEKRANIRRDTSHHISKAIAESAPVVAAFEDINLSNLTRRAKPKQCPETGKWLRNNAAAKSGLNRAILGLNLGQLRDFTAYKLIERDKLIVKVRAAYSSQECSVCGNTCKANRPSQALFSCIQCHHTENADDNAAKVIKKRGVEYVLSPAFTKLKAAKRVTTRKNKVQAFETASLGARGHGKPGVLPAQTDDGLNGQVHAGCGLRVQEASPD